MINNRAQDETEINSKINAENSKNCALWPSSRNNDLKNIKEKIDDFSEYIDDIIDKEWDNELNIYLFIQSMK